MLMLNRDRRELLDLMRRGRIVQTSGRIFRVTGTGNGKVRCDTQVRLLVDAGWARLAANGSTYELTEEGLEKMEN